MFPVALGRFIYWFPVLELLKIFAQNLHIYITEMILLHRALYTLFTYFSWKT